MIVIQLCIYYKKLILGGKEMGYEVISSAGKGGVLDPLGDFICVSKDTTCNKECDCGQDFGCNIPINGKCDGGGHKDFKCTRNGGCKVCEGIKSSRFSQY